MCYHNKKTLLSCDNNVRTHYHQKTLCYHVIMSRYLKNAKKKKTLALLGIRSIHCFRHYISHMYHNFKEGHH